ncbi:MAG: hypothetical protein HKN13_09530 [Rhodothermales bacterium]|nr:hypothetical protein [Rhodothermales bacterium]
MALGTTHTTVESAAVFIPEVWSDEVIASFKENLVLANRVTEFNHSGKKGDTINVPNFTRGTASQKAQATQITLIASTESNTAISINQHWEYSVLIEDIVGTQMLDSYRMAYTDDAGHSLATLVDRYLMWTAMLLQGGDTAGGFESGNAYNTAGDDFGGAAVIGGDGSTTYDGSADNATDITDEGIRTMILTLDNADVPQSERTIVVPPVCKKDLLGLARYTEQAFVGEGGINNSIRSGLIGDLYGVPVFVSTNCPSTTEGSVAERMGLMVHRSAIALATQLDVRTQTQYKQEYLGDLFTADTLFGAAELRNDAGIVFAVPAA